MTSKQNETPIDQVNENGDEQKAQTEAQDGNDKDAKITELEAKVAELNDKYLRLYSEFDNYRRRTAKERLELTQTAGEEFFKSLLPVVDDFERAIKSNADTTDVKTINDGVGLIYHKLKTTLQQKGLEEMKSLGETFDADVHEAITNIPAPSDDMKGKVMDEIEKGYTLNGKIIRFAKVVIGN